MTTTPQAIKALRKTLMDKRHQINTQDRARSSQDICDMLMSLLSNCLPAEQSFSISGFCPLEDEINLLPLLQELCRKGHEVCLPVVAERNAPLLFYPWTPYAKLIPGAFGVLEPEKTMPVTPEILIVPLLGFTLAGDRIGYGRGYYDRTIHALKAQKLAWLTIGVAFDEQILPPDYVPQPHDERLDYIITPTRIIRSNTNSPVH